tara:strand:- start:296 stop:886 length:591 start_codon:yes stop_codon:yes gene_type:complete
LKSLQEKGVRIVVVEEIGTRKGTTGAVTEVEEMITKKVETGFALNAITPIFPSERSVIAVKQIDLEMVQVSLKENSNGEEIIPKNLEIGLVLSATILTSPSEINAIAAMHIVQILMVKPNQGIIAEIIDKEGTIVEILSLKKDMRGEGEVVHQEVAVDLVDLDLEDQAGGLQEVIDQEEAAVGAESLSPEHSSLLN